MKFFSSKRFNVALALATLVIIYIFNFVAVYVNILANRSLARQIFAYGFNILIFTVIFYSIFTLFIFLYSITFGRKKL